MSRLSFFRQQLKLGLQSMKKRSCSSHSREIIYKIMPASILDRTWARSVAWPNLGCVHTTEVLSSDQIFITWPCQKQDLDTFTVAHKNLVWGYIAIGSHRYSHIQVFIFQTTQLKRFLATYPFCFRLLARINLQKKRTTNFTGYIITGTRIVPVDQACLLPFLPDLEFSMFVFYVYSFPDQIATTQVQYRLVAAALIGCGTHILKPKINDSIS